MKQLIIILTILTFQIQVSASFFYESTEASRTTKNPVINKRAFKRIVKTMETEFIDYANKFDEQLLMYAGWNNPTADHALARRWETAQVLIFRGMAHRREIDRDALVLIICHELGHLYGGVPLKNERDYIAAEGQADYFATNHCLKRSLKIFDPINVDQRALKAIDNVGKFLANNWGHSHPSQSTPDLSEVEETYMSYPTPQCRFDTLIAGLSKEERPRCWYAKP